MLTNILANFVKKQNSSKPCSLVVYIDKSNNLTRIIEHNKAVNTMFTNKN